jgi:hypothetical protein
MLLVDGRFGPETGVAVAEARAALQLPGPGEADEAFLATVSALPDPFPSLSAAGLTFIARAEVTSPSAYRRKFQRPCLPSEASGITIGIGYDCQFATPAQLAADWGDLLPPATIGRLAPALGVVGTPAVVADLQDVVVPLQSAMRVFATRSLPKFLDLTRGIYPAVPALSLARRTALVSLVYSRGSRLTDKDPVRQDRREMRNIQTLLAAHDDDLVADELESMTRLWDPQTLGGLVQRRKDEAVLWRAGFGPLMLE